MPTNDFMDVPDELMEAASGGMANAITKSMAKWNRKAADLYPTPPDCIYSLAPHIRDLVPEGTTILEPACANGQISRALIDCGYDVVSYDLRPDPGYGVGGVDFLDRKNGMFEVDEFDCILTNPPFAAAVEFIERGLELSPVLILLLKSNYFHTKNRISLFESFTPSREYKLTWRPAFLEKERGKSPLMDCSWYVFERGRNAPYVEARPIERLMVPEGMDLGGL